MKNTISQMAQLSGVSVRTLHYYHKIGLLSPCEVTQKGYRFYDEESMERLQQILFYRELEFPLKEILILMNAREYNQRETLMRQKELLLLKRKRLDGLIQLLESSLKGERAVSFEKFDNREMEETKARYAKEARERWGETSAYLQYQNKTARYDTKDWEGTDIKRKELLKAFSQLIGSKPESPEVQDLIRQWQQYITESFYDCTDEILAGLGKMYLADQRFTEYMNQYGEGTAQLISEGIAIYCEP